MWIRLLGPFNLPFDSDFPGYDIGFRGNLLLDLDPLNGTAIVGNIATGARSVLSGTGIGFSFATGTFTGTVTAWSTRDSTTRQVAFADGFSWALQDYIDAANALAAEDQAPLLALLSRQSIIIDAGFSQDPARALMPEGITSGIEFRGSGFSDAFRGSAGNDTFYGGSGNNTLEGAAGDDTLIGGDGDDILYGGTGDDSLLAAAGNNLLVGGEGNDTLQTGPGNDTVWAGPGDDRVQVGLGVAEVWAGPGNDTLTGALGNDTLGGGSGDDLIDARAGGQNQLWGGDGHDTLHASNAGGVAGGGAGDDIVFGGAGHDTLMGGSGQDTLQGGAGNDVLYLGFGNDQALGGAGNDTIFAGPGFDRLWGGAGADRFEFWRGYGWNRIEDFSAAEGDTLSLGRALWTATHGNLTAQQVVNTFGRINPAGDALLDFGPANTTVVLVGTNTLAGLADSLLLL